MLSKTSFCALFAMVALMVVSQIGCRACGTCYDYSPPVQGCMDGCGCESEACDSGACGMSECGDACGSGCSTCSNASQRHSTARRASSLGGSTTMMTDGTY